MLRGLARQRILVDLDGLPEVHRQIVESEGHVGMLRSDSLSLAPPPRQCGNACEYFPAASNRLDSEGG
jgi:hypothetical protein